MSELDTVIDQIESHAALAREQKLRAEIKRLQERLKGSDMLAHVRGEQIERLRELVRSAYAEGFSEGMNEHTKFNGGKPWEDSRARRALEGK